MPLAQVMRGSQIGWYWVNSAVPLTIWLPPATTMRDQLKLVPLMVEDVAGIDLPVSSIVAPALIVPALIAVARSVRSALASTIAPSMLSAPAP